MSLVLIVFLPLFSFIICGLFRNVLSNKQVAVIASGLVIISAVLSMQMLWQTSQDSWSIQHIKLFNWFAVDGFGANWALYADKLSIIMLSMVCVISSVVHLYSIGYMAQDERFNTFMAYLSLFTFSMLMLVCADNLLLFFLGGVGVGLCSYLLIGFWYRKNSANLACYKAFIVNRLADVAMLIGIILLAYNIGGVEFARIEHYVDFLAGKYISYFNINMLELICLLLFIGCMGKSAQIGLHVWLPDAMEGPTPVSALIHAATMVTAGVFLVARLNFVFARADHVCFLMAGVGAITCLLAGLMAMWQNDIKKIIAYSTCSQLGYMFIACGAKAYHAAIFHLLTHAFFKAALFLAAGNVIHATSKQKLDEIGNIRVNMKATFIIFIISSAAIMGIPPFAGFYSKDLILEYAADLNWLIFALGVISAACTGFYSAKILTSIFTNKLAVPQSHAHEAGIIMLLPLLVLVLGSIFAGFVGVHVLKISSQSGYFAETFEYSDLEHNSNYVKFLPLLFSIIGAIAGYMRVGVTALSAAWANVIKNGFYFDYMYESIVVPIWQNLAVAGALFDVYVIDKLGPQNLVSASKALGRIVAKWQSGYVFDYSAVMLFVMFLSILVLAF